MKRYSVALCSRIALAMGTIMGPAMIASPAVAQDTSASDESDVNTIIVTAQRREEKLQQVPLSITAVTSEDLANRGTLDLKGISQIAPSLNVEAYPNSSDTLSLNIRGQGVADAGQITKDGGVGLYVDGFYISRPQGALLDLGDPQRIEVLRGPQGTLYGRNTTGGAVNIITSKPSGVLDGKTSLTFGSRNMVRGFATVDLPEFANIAIKGTIIYSDQDGWVKNPGAANTFHKFGQLAGRVAVRWTPTADLTVDYAWDHGRITTTQPYYVNPDLIGVVSGYTGSIDTTYHPIDIGLSKTHFTDHQITVNWDASSALTLRSLTGFRNTDSFQDVNYDVAQSFPIPGFTFTVAQQHYYRSKQFTQELQVIGSIGDLVEYTGGLYYFNERGSHDQYQQLGLPAALGGYTETTRLVDARSISKAAYLQATIIPPILDERLKLTIGGRYTEDKRSATRNQFYFTYPFEVDVNNHQRFKNFSPSVNLAMQWTPDILTYVRYSRGYKAGGSGEAAADFIAGTYGPEKIEAWEAGLKSQFFNHMVTFNATVFSNQFKDLQVDFTTDPIDLTQVSTVNAGKASVRGVEVELMVRPVRAFGINASYAYLDPKLDSIIAPVGTNFDPARNPYSPVQVGDDVTDYFVLPFAPKHSFTVAADWTIFDHEGQKLTAYANYAYQSSVYTSSVAGPIVAGRDFWRSDKREIVNARLVWDQPLSIADVSLTLFANNLFDRRAREFVIGIGNQLPSATGAGGYFSQTAPWSEPRVIGATLKAEF